MIAHHPEAYRYSETEKHPLCEVAGAIIHGGILAWDGQGPPEVRKRSFELHRHARGRRGSRAPTQLVLLGRVLTGHAPPTVLRESPSDSAEPKLKREQQW